MLIQDISAYLLRRDDVDGAKFVPLTLFDSLDAVRAFAGEQYETAVISDAARAVLRDFDSTAQHFRSSRCAQAHPHEHCRIHAFISPSRFPESRQGQEDGCKTGWYQRSPDP